MKWIIIIFLVAGCQHKLTPKATIKKEGNYIKINESEDIRIYINQDSVIIRSDTTIRL